MRICQTSDYGDFGLYRHYRHVTCLSLKRKYKDLKPEDIKGLDLLKEEDKKKVIEYFEEEAKDLKEK